jgi:serine/threonine protein kinase
MTSPDQQDDKTVTSAVGGERGDAERNSLTGKQLGNYVLDEEIGRGGMGVIYKAHHKVMNRTVAIKVLNKKLAEGVWPKRFENEAKLLSLLSHPNVVSVYDFGFEPDGSAYLVMDYLQGESLSQALAGGTLNIQRFCEIMLEVCHGLIAAHEKGLIHRDIKPSNIFLAKDESGAETVKLLDFGLAKDSTVASQKLTSTGEIVGTPLYMSPELLRTRDLDARADLYSLGCVMYECLSGQPPFRGDSAVETAVLHLNSPPPRLMGSNYDRKTTQQLNIILESCLAKAPVDRYKSVSELAADLERLRANEAIQRKRHPLRAAAKGEVAMAIACSIIGIAAIGFTIANKDKQPPRGNGSHPVLRKLIAQASDRGIDEKEFVRVHVQTMHVKPGDAQKAFAILDQDHNQFIDKDEMIAELLVCNAERLEPPVFIRRLGNGDPKLERAVRTLFASVKRDEAH